MAAATATAGTAATAAVDMAARATTPGLKTSTGRESKLVRRGDFEPKLKKKRHSSTDYTTVYLPNG